MARPSNPRRQLLKRVREIKNRLNIISDVWGVASTVYDAMDGNGNAALRPRHEDEYPENQSLAWSVLYRDLTRLRNELNDLQLFALDEWRKCESVPGDPMEGEIKS